MTADSIFVVQEHHAKRLHWDFRLEIDGTLKSWVVPKGPSLDSTQRRLAIQVPDHDMEHANYEGIIPEGTYAAGPVLIWDKGSSKAIDDEPPAASLAKGNLKLDLYGRILKGAFCAGGEGELRRTHGPSPLRIGPVS